MTEGIPLARPSAEVPRRESEQRGHKPPAGQQSEDHHRLLRTSSLCRAGRLCGPPWPDLPRLIATIPVHSWSRELASEEERMETPKPLKTQTPCRGLGSIPSCWLWRGGQLRVSWSPLGARAALAGTGLGILRVLRALCQKLHASVEPATVLWQRKTWPAGSLPSVGGSDRPSCSLRASLVVWEASSK